MALNIANANVTVSDIQMEEGSVSTPYEPYTGGQPSPNPDYPQEVEVVEGYNLFKFGNNTVTSKGRTYILENGELKATGISTGENTINLVTGTIIGNYATNMNLTEENSIFIKAGTYKLRKRNIGTHNPSLYYLYGNIGDTYATGTNGTLAGNLLEKELVIPNDCYITFAIYDYSTTGAEMHQKDFYFSQKDKPYMPYNSIGLKFNGKNIGNVNQLYEDMYSFNSAFLSKENIDNKKCIKFGNSKYGGANLLQLNYKENTSYTFRFLGRIYDTTITTGKELYVQIFYKDGTRNYDRHPADGSNWIEFRVVSAPSKTVHHITFSYGSGGDWLLDENSFNIIEGDSTQYELYKETIYPIDLTNNFIGKLPNGVKDELSIDKQGNVILNKKVGRKIFNGSEDIYDYSQIFNNIKAFRYSSDIFKNNDSKIQCDCFNPTYITKFNSDQRTYGMTMTLEKETTLVGGYLYFSQPNEQINTVESFKQWLSTHNTTVYYELATPHTVDLGNIDPIDMFVGTNNILVLTNIDTNYNMRIYNKSGLIPTLTSQLINDSGFITQSGLGDYALASEAANTMTMEVNTDYVRMPYIVFIIEFISG